jgi:alginate O-acetyltransferase complex protein AlgJ
VGRDGWLHFRPDVQHLTGPAFLDRPEAWAEMEAFAELRAPGRELFVLLVPAKTAIHPERLVPELAGAAPLANPSTPELIGRLRQSGIGVIDLAQLLASAAASTGRAQYLRTDTHWTPEAMDLAARAVAEAIAPSLSGRPRAGYSRRADRVAGQGDLARLLRLPEKSRLFAAETVSIQRVYRAGEAVRPARAAPVLLLGDSFSLIYSDPGLGFGDSAGLAEQLAFHLQQPVDRLAVYAGGARAALARELAADPSRLEGKRVIVYQLAARHLSASDVGGEDVTASSAASSRDPSLERPAPRQ